MDSVHALLAIYGAPDASAANLLCDRHDPNQVAYRLIASDLTATDLTYGELRRESERVAAGLRALGLGPGDRIATLMGKSRAYLATLMAIWRLGAVHVPLFTAFAPPAIAYRLKSSGAALVVCDAAQRPKLVSSEAIPESPPWLVATTGPVGQGDISYDFLSGCPDAPPTAARLGGEAPIIQLYTSGTTGAPKAVLVPLRAVAAFETYARYGLGLISGDVFWNAADPGWAYGLYYGVLTTFATGVESLLLEGGFSGETTLAILERFKVTNLTAAPTVYRALRSAGLRPSQPLSLRCASSAGEPLTPDVNEWAINALGVQVHDHYGQTETGMLINNHHHPALKQPLKIGSMGLPLPGWSVAILNIEVDELAMPGELGRVAIALAASPFAWFTEYVGDPAISAEKFADNRKWYLTGDLGRIDEEGRFYFSSRADDVILMAGYRIGPSDIEAVILSHQAVAECAVVATPDEVRGEVLEAVVVLKPTYSPSETLCGEIQAQVKQGYGAHAYPRRVHFVSQLPKTPSGKLQRFLVKQQLLQQSESRPSNSLKPGASQ